MNMLIVVVLLAAELVAFAAAAVFLYARAVSSAAYRAAANTRSPARARFHTSESDGFGLYALGVDEQRHFQVIEKMFLAPGRFGLANRLTRRLYWPTQVGWQRLKRAFVVAVLPPVGSLLAYGVVWDTHQPAWGHYPKGLPVTAFDRTMAVAIGGATGLAVALTCLVIFALRRRKLRRPRRREGLRKPDEATGLHSLARIWNRVWPGWGPRKYGL